MTTFDSHDRAVIYGAETAASESLYRSRRRRQAVRHRRRRSTVAAGVGTLIAWAAVVYMGAGGPSWPH